LINVLGFGQFSMFQTFLMR